MAHVIVRNLVKQYGELQVVHSVDFEIGDGEFVVLVGPSGCGKSTIARHLFPVSREEAWPDDRSLLDAFPPELSIKDVVELLSSVGFSSPPAWLRPYRVLSTGQQFRVNLARLLASAKPGQPCVIDEFTSTVDRTVALVETWLANNRKKAA